MLTRRSKRLLDQSSASAVAAAVSSIVVPSEAIKVKTEAVDEHPAKRLKIEHIEVKIEPDFDPTASMAVKLEASVTNSAELITNTTAGGGGGAGAAGNPYIPAFDDAEFDKEYAGYTAPHAPPGWQEIYKRVKQMRTREVAPVDTMGCERIPESVSATITPAVHRFQLLVALMLSAQTKDEVTAAAVQKLRTELPGRQLTVSSVLAAEEAEIDKIIYSVGFHRRKANFLKRAAVILREKYADDVPPTLEEIVSLPGVGPKMGHLLMHRAWGRVEGIGVDVHVHRLGNLWRWTNDGKAKTPEDSRHALEDWLPRSLWVDINPTLVGFGQTVCRPQGKRCGDCLIASLCPGYMKGAGTKKPKRR
jgi:endonuclease III